MGASLLALFLNLRFPLGIGTVIVAHIMFIISFVVVTVKARLQGMDPRLEEAARDLYANPRAVFRYVTFPLVLPGILGAALLGFSLSFDDFIISFFNAGTLVTFPIYIWGAAQRGIPVQVNALATIVFLVALAVVLDRSVRQQPSPQGPGEGSADHRRPDVALLGSNGGRRVGRIVGESSTLDRTAISMKGLVGRRSAKAPHSDPLSSTDRSISY